MRKKKILLSILVLAVLQFLVYNFRFAYNKQFTFPNFLAQNKLPETITEILTKLKLPQYNSSLTIPVLVIAYNRPSVDRCIKSILRARPSSTHFPIFVSQDGFHKDTETAIRTFHQVYYLRQTNQTHYPLTKKKAKLQGYFHLSRHYKWALNQVFDKFNYSSCIVVEDDLEVSLDFFEYMIATHNLLKTDSSLYCVSAWNDNGKPELIDGERSELIHRTDFFPGLGWMLTRNLWEELEPNWPVAFWDDWMRSPEIRKNRSCLRPELSRTTNFGNKGVSNGLHFKTFLGRIAKFDGFVPFTLHHLEYLLLDTYNEAFLRKAYAAKLVDYKDLIKALKDGDGDGKYKADSFRVSYSFRKEFQDIAKAFGIMMDFKSGIPRTAYRGIIPFKFLGKSIFVSPIYDWRGYNVTWN